MINVTKGTDNGEECLFLYGMSTFNTGDYESAAEIFKKCMDAVKSSPAACAENGKAVTERSNNI
jgi:cytochrome c-type biogenesis protein CcmH/NrfG